MKEQLALLDSLLQNSRPDFYEQLNSPLTVKEIEALEKLYGMKVPKELVSLYTWKNGQSSDSYEAFVNNSTFLPLDEVLETAVDMTSMIDTDFEIENWWNREWYPLFQNGGGDYLCFDNGGIFTGVKGQLIEFWHAENDRNVVAPSVERFIESIVEYYRTTPVDDFDEFFILDNIDGYPIVNILEE